MVCLHVIFRFFLDDMNTPPNLRNDLGDTPLNAAAYTGQCAAVEELLRHGADVNAKNNKVHSMLTLLALSTPLILQKQDLCRVYFCGRV